MGRLCGPGEGTSFLRPQFLHLYSTDILQLLHFSSQKGETVCENRSAERLCFSAFVYGRYIHCSEAKYIWQSLNQKYTEANDPKIFLVKYDFSIFPGNIFEFFRAKYQKNGGKAMVDYSSYGLDMNSTNIILLGNKTNMILSHGHGKHH